MGLISNEEHGTEALACRGPSHEDGVPLLGHRRVRLLELQLTAAAVDVPSSTAAAGGMEAGAAIALRSALSDIVATADGQARDHLQRASALEALRGGSRLSYRGGSGAERAEAAACQHADQAQRLASGSLERILHAVAAEQSELERLATAVQRAAENRERELLASADTCAAFLERLKSSGSAYSWVRSSAAKLHALESSLEATASAITAADDI